MAAGSEEVSRGAPQGRVRAIAVSHNSDLVEAAQLLDCLRQIHASQLLEHGLVIGRTSSKRNQVGAAGEFLLCHADEEFDLERDIDSLADERCQTVARDTTGHLVEKVAEGHGVIRVAAS